MSGHLKSTMAKRKTSVGTPYWMAPEVGYKFIYRSIGVQGAQWVSGRVLDSRLRGCGFKPHWRHCVVVLEQDTFILA